MIVGQDRAHVGVVDAQHRDAVERQPLQEVDERARQPREVVAVGLHVVGVDVGDDRDHRRQIEERRVGLVGLGDQELALAEPRVRVRGQQPPADDERRIEPAFGEHRGDEARRRRLAVRAGDRDALLQAHQLGQHQRARHDGNAALARGDDFRVVGAPPRSTRRRRRRRATFAAAWPIAIVDAEPRETARHRALGEIGARHAIALRREHLGDAAHAGAADADEVHALDLVLHRRALPRASRHDVGDARRRRRRVPHACARATRHRERASRGRAPRAHRRGAAASASRCGDTSAPRRASTRNCALALCSSAIAPGSGTSSAPRPTAASSATVIAPPRQIDDVRPA